MGALKHWAGEMMAGGMDLRHVAGLSVCRACVQDPALSAWVEAHASRRSCSYCDRNFRSLRAAAVAELVRFVNTGLSREYDDAEDALGRDRESENGWFGETSTTEEVLEAELELTDNEARFVVDLATALGDRSWCKADPYGLAEHELLSWSWRAFREMTLHDRRFFFREAARRQRRTDDETPTVEELLDGFLSYCRRARLFRKLPTGTVFYRCQRKGKGDKASYTAGRMGPPPAEKAVQANRMSPAGISMFYGAGDPDTALVETLDTPGLAAIGGFATLRPIVVLDLSRRPPMPSILEDGARDARVWARFLREFLADFTRPISRDGREHIDYVPTQIVAEYIRVFARYRKLPVDGIRYSSARRRDETCVVLFAENGNVEGPHSTLVPSRRPWLRMTSYTERRFKPVSRLKSRSPATSLAMSAAAP